MCISSLAGTARVPLTSNLSTSCSGNKAWASHGTKCAVLPTSSTTFYHTMGSWYPQGISSYLSGFGLSPSQHLTHVEQPVDALIDGLIKSQETIFLGQEAKIYWSKVKHLTTPPYHRGRAPIRSSTGQQQFSRPKAMCWIVPLGCECKAPYWVLEIMQ